MLEVVRLPVVWVDLSELVAAFASTATGGIADFDLSGVITSCCAIRNLDPKTAKPAIRIPNTSR